MKTKHSEVDFNSSLLQTRKAYNSISRWYDLVVGKKEKQIIQEGISTINPSPNDFILDIGCGTGNGLISIYKEFQSQVNILGVDISEGMLLKAKRKIQKNDISNIYLQLADARSLPYTDDIFSAVVLSFSLELFTDEDIPSLLNECVRVVQSRGKIIVVCLSLNESLPVLIYTKFHELFPKIIDCRPIDLLTYISSPKYKTINQSQIKMGGIPIDIFTLTIDKGKN